MHRFESSAARTTCRVLWAATAGVAGLALVGCPPLPVTDSLALQPVVSGLVSPVALTVPPNDTGRLFVVDQIGLIRVVSGDTLLEQPFLDLRAKIIPLSPTYDERGLLGLAFHPSYATNRRFFVFYNSPPQPDTPGGFDDEVRVSEFLVSESDPNVADADSERILLRAGKPQFNHNGGQLAFGNDGLLYISIGDGGGANDNDFGHTPGTGNAQDLSNGLGKILRMNVDQGSPYGIPVNNPFVNDPNARPEIWAYGLRNPWRFSFDRETGRLFAADAGQDLFEEVNIVVSGGNYG